MKSRCPNLRDSAILDPEEKAELELFYVLQIFRSF